MSWWPSYSGRYSPFSFYGRSEEPPKVTEDDYSYMTGNEAPPSHTSHHHHNHPQHHRRDSGKTSSPHHIRHQDSNASGTRPHSHHTHARPSARIVADDLDLEPDRINLKHKGKTYPLAFRAFAIADAHLTLGDLRDAAAEELQVSDPRRIRLLYKGRKLVNDAESCKKQGLKQNSEVLCVICTDPEDEIEDAHDRDETDTSTTTTEKKKRKNHRGTNKKKPPKENQTSIPVHESHPSSSISTPPLPKKKHLTPAEALDQIHETFTKTILPEIQSFLNDTPTEIKARDYEQKRLGEATLTQVLLKLDEVDTTAEAGGSAALRERRKELVREVQGWLSKLDAVGKE